jgi:hypothetical protein
MKASTLLPRFIWIMLLLVSVLLALAVLFGSGAAIFLGH